MSVPTQITIHPDRPVGEAGWAFPDSATRRVGERHRFAGESTGGEQALFGADGLGLDDVIDTLNPLQHIPFVSTLYRELTGDKVSAGAQLIGGTLIGGPLGFLAALGNVIFEQETGRSAGGAVVASLLGKDAPATAVATASAPSPARATLTPVAEAASATPVPPVTVASTAPSTPASAEDRALLTLFGPAEHSAHDSYRKAQFRSYLSDVSTSTVL